MRRYVSAGCLLLLLSTARAQVGTVPAEKGVTSSTPIRSHALGQVAYDALVSTAIEDHLPFGIVIGPDHAICTARITTTAVHQITTAGDLIDEFNTDVPGYRALLEGGVVNVVPSDVPQEVQKILRMKIGHFESAPSTMSRLGIKLYFEIQAVLHPSQGLAFAGGSSPAAEVVPAIDVREQTVKQIMNAVIRSGHHGMWLYRTEISDADSQLPFEIRSYVGELVSGQRHPGCAQH